MEATLTTPFPVLAMVAWVAALTIVARDWARRSAAARSAMDGPQMLLAAAAHLLPEQRADWGRAMSAELAQLGSSRWRFALGCAKGGSVPTAQQPATDGRRGCHDRRHGGLHRPGRRPRPAGVAGLRRHPHGPRRGAHDPGRRPLPQTRPDPCRV